MAGGDAGARLRNRAARRGARRCGSPGGTSATHPRHRVGRGRRTDGVDDAGSARSDDVVARYFEEAAALEALSVLAFRRLARELAARDAPPSLVAGAEAAARDEIRHARVVGHLAARFGGRRPALPVATLPLRALDEVAVENAVEGCVRETYGALVASCQALTTADARVRRRAFSAIAVDEERHAELAWPVARWAERRLDGAARRRLRKARRDAVLALVREIERTPPAPLVRLAGLPPVAAARLPPVAAARRLADEARTRLWDAA